MSVSTEDDSADKKVTEGYARCKKVDPFAVTYLVDLALKKRHSKSN